MLRLVCVALPVPMRVLIRRPYPVLLSSCGGVRIGMRIPRVRGLVGACCGSAACRYMGQRGIGGSCLGRV